MMINELYMHLFSITLVCVHSYEITTLTWLIKVYYRGSNDFSADLNDFKFELPLMRIDNWD